MSETNLTNLGSQTINWKYKTSLKGNNLSQMFNGCISPGLYLNNGVAITKNTGIVSWTAQGDITLAPFTATFNCLSDNKIVHISTAQSIDLYPNLGYITSGLPYILMSYTWQDQILNYIHFSFASSYTKYDIVIGKATFSGSMNGVDYSEATYPPIYNPLTHTFAIRNTPPTINTGSHTSYKALYIDTATGEILISS